MRRTLAMAFCLSLLALSGFPGPRSAWSSGPPYPKLALHVQPWVAKACKRDVTSELRCADNPTSDTYNGVVSSGEILEEYQVYLLALDIPVELGLREVAVQYDLFPADALVVSWVPCPALEEEATPWETGTGRVLRLSECAGTTSLASDPEGDGAAILGYFEVYAYAPSQVSVSGPGEGPSSAASMIDCSGSPIPGGAILQTVGVAGFGYPGINPCNAPHEGCGFVPGMTVPHCCGLVEGSSAPSRRACEQQGGVYIRAPCFEDPNRYCPEVPVRSVHWSTIKTLHD